MLAALVVLAGCASVESAHEPEDKVDERGASSTVEPVAVRFERHYQELKAFQKTRLKSSSTDDLLDCDAYRAIVEGGDEFVPLVIETIRDGDYLMNRAMTEITGIKMHEYFPGERVLGEQKVSRQWLRWWEENRDRYLPEASEP